MAISLSGLLLGEVGVTRSPPVKSPPPTVPNTGPTPVPFHSILFVYVNGPLGVGSPVWPPGSENLTFGAALWASYVPEINDQQTWAAFWNSSVIACGWPPSNSYCPALPEVDFKTRTVLLVSPGRGTWGDNFNLTRVISYRDHLRLEGFFIGVGCGLWVEMVVTSVLIVDIPKTQLPASLYAALTRGPSCPV